MIAGVSICLSLPITAFALAVANDFIGVWTSNSGNTLEYRQNGNQIDVIMADPSAKFKELGYLSGEVTGHYSFSGGKITGRILLKFLGCPPAWASASNAIGDDGMMTVQVALLRCNTNTGTWEYLGGTNKATLTKTQVGTSTTNAQSPSSVDGSQVQINQLPAETVTAPQEQTTPLQDEHPLANNSAPQIADVTSQKTSQDPNNTNKLAPPPDTKAVDNNSPSASNPAKSLKETIGGWCAAVGVILCVLGAGKRDRRYKSGVRGGSSTLLAIGIFLLAVGVILIFIPLPILVAVCVVPFVFFAIIEVRKKNAQSTAKLAEEERARLARVRMEEDARRADEVRDFLLAKYRDDRIVDRIVANEFWLGQTSEQLRDSLGSPSHVGNQTSTGETWKYGETGKNRYALHVNLRNGVVTDWKDNR